MFSKKENQPIKIWHKIFLIAMLISAAALGAYSWYWPRALVKIGGRELKVLVAEGARHRYQGLSNKKSFGNYDGMLFVFPERAQHTMVMRQMNFPIDIIWIDGEKIIDIAPNAPPEAGRAEQELRPYFARAVSTLVLELPAGFAKEKNLRVGDVIQVEQK